MNLGLSLGLTIHARKKSDGTFVYRVKKSNYNEYLTDELTEGELREWILKKYRVEAEKMLNDTLLHSEHGVVTHHLTSDHAIARARSPDQPWDDE